MIKIYHVLKIFQEPPKRKLFVSNLYQAFRYLIYNRPNLQNTKFVWKGIQQVNKATCRFSIPSGLLRAEVPTNLLIARMFSSSKSGRTKLSKSNAVIKVSSDKYHLLTFSAKNKNKSEGAQFCKVNNINTNSNNPTKTDPEKKIIDLFYDNKNKININKLKQQGKNVYETLVNKFSLSNITTVKSTKKISSFNSSVKKYKTKDDVNSSKKEILVKNAKDKITNKSAEVISGQDNKSHKSDMNKQISDKPEDIKALTIINAIYERDDRAQRKRKRDKTNSYVLSKENNNITRTSKAKLFKKYQPELDYRLKKLAEKYSKPRVVRSLKKEVGKGVMKKPMKKDKYVEIGIKQKVLKHELKKKLERDASKPQKKTNAYITTEPKPKLPLITSVYKNVPKSERTILTIDLKGCIESKTQNLPNVNETMPTIQVSNNSIEPKNKSEHYQNKELPPVVIDYKSLTLNDTIIKINGKKTTETNQDKKHTPEVGKKILVLSVVGKKDVQSSKEPKIEQKTEKNSLKCSSHDINLRECKRNATLNIRDISRSGEQKPFESSKSSNTKAVNEEIPQNEMDEESVTLVNMAEVDRYTELLKRPSSNVQEAQRSFLNKVPEKNELIGSQTPEIHEKGLKNNCIFLEANVDKKRTNLKNLDLLNESSAKVCKTETVSSQMPMRKQSSNIETPAAIEIIDKEKLLKNANENKVITNLNEKKGTVEYKSTRNNNLLIETQMERMSENQNKSCIDLSKNSSTSIISNEVKPESNFNHLPKNNSEEKSTNTNANIAENTSVKTGLAGESRCISENKLYNSKSLINKTSEKVAQKNCLSANPKNSSTPLQSLKKTNAESVRKFGKPNAKYPEINGSKSLIISKTESAKTNYSKTFMEQKLQNKAGEKWSTIIGQGELKTTKSLENTSGKMKPLREQVIPLTSSNKDYIGKLKLQNEVVKNTQCLNRVPLKNSLIQQNATKKLEKDLNTKSIKFGKDLKSNELSKHKNIHHKNEEISKKETVINKTQVSRLENTLKLTTKDKKPPEVKTVNIQMIDSSGVRKYKENKTSNISGILIKNTCQKLEKVEHKITPILPSQMENMCKSVYNNKWLAATPRIIMLQAENKILLISKANQFSTEEHNIIEQLMQIKDVKIQCISPLALDYFTVEFLKNIGAVKKCLNSHVFMQIETTDSKNQTELFDSFQNIRKYRHLSRIINPTIIGDNCKIRTHQLPSSQHDTSELYRTGSNFFMNGLNKVAFHKVLNPFKETEGSKLKVQIGETWVIPKEINGKNRENKILSDIKAEDGIKSKMKDQSDLSTALKSPPVSEKDVASNMQNYGNSIVQNKPTEGSSFLDAENSTLPGRFKPKGSEEKMLKSPSIMDSKNMSSYTKFIKASDEEKKLLAAIKITALNEGALDSHLNNIHVVKANVNDKNLHTFSGLINYMKNRRANNTNLGRHEELTKKSRLTKSMKPQEIEKMCCKNEGVLHDLINIPPRSVSYNYMPTGNSLLDDNLFKKSISTMLLQNKYGNASEKNIIDSVVKNLTSHVSKNDKLFNFVEAKMDKSKYTKNEKNGTYNDQRLNEDGLSRAELLNHKEEDEAVRKYMDKMKHETMDSHKKNTGNSVSTVSKDSNNKLPYSKTNNLLNDNHVMKESSNVGLKTEKWRLNSPTRVIASFDYSSEASSNKNGKENKIQPLQVQNKMQSAQITDAQKESCTQLDCTKDSPLNIRNNYKIGCNTHEIEVNAKTKEDEGDTTFQLNIKYLVNKASQSGSNQLDAGKYKLMEDNLQPSIEKLKPPKLSTYNKIKNKRDGNFEELTAYIKNTGKIDKMNSIVKNNTGSFEELLKIIKNNSERNLKSKKPKQSFQNSNSSLESIVRPTANYPQPRFHRNKASQIGHSMKVSEEVDEMFREGKKFKLELKEVPTSMMQFVEVYRKYESQEQYNQSNKSNKISKIYSKENTLKPKNSPADISKRVEEILSKKRYTQTIIQAIQNNTLKNEPLEVSTSLNNELKKKDTKVSDQINGNKSSPDKKPNGDKIVDGKKLDESVSVLDDLPQTHFLPTLPIIFTASEFADNSNKNDKQNETGNTQAKTIPLSQSIQENYIKFFQKQNFNEASKKPVHEGTECCEAKYLLLDNDDFKALKAKLKEINGKEIKNSSAYALNPEKIGNTQGLNTKRNNNEETPLVKDDLQKYLNLWNKNQNDSHNLNNVERQINSQSDINTDKVPGPSRFLKERANDPGKHERAQINLNDFSNVATTQAKNSNENDDFFNKKQVEKPRRELENKTKLETKNPVFYTFKKTVHENHKNKTINKQEKILQQNALLLNENKSENSRNSIQRKKNKVAFLDNQMASGILKQINSPVDIDEIYKKEEQTNNSFFNEEEILQRTGRDFNSSRINEKFKKPLNPYKMSNKRKVIHLVTNQIKTEPILETRNKQKQPKKYDQKSLLVKTKKNVHGNEAISHHRFSNSSQTRIETISKNKVECVSLHSLGLSTKCENEGFLSQSLRSESTTDPSSLFFSGKMHVGKKKDLNPGKIKFNITKYRHNKTEENDSRLKTAELTNSKGMNSTKINMQSLTSPNTIKKHQEIQIQHKHSEKNQNRKNLAASIKAKRSRLQTFISQNEPIRKKKLPVRHFACTTPSIDVHKAKVDVVKQNIKYNTEPEGIFESFNHQNTIVNDKLENEMSVVLDSSRCDSLSDLVLSEKITSSLNEKKITKMKPKGAFVPHHNSTPLLLDPGTKQYIPLMANEPGTGIFEDPEMVKRKELSTQISPNNNDETNQTLEDRSKNEKVEEKQAELTSLMGSVVTNVKTKLQGIPMSMSKLITTQSHKSWLDLSDIMKSKVLEDFTLSNFQRKLKHFQEGMKEKNKKGTKYFVLGNLKERKRGENKIIKNISPPSTSKNTQQRLSKVDAKNDFPSEDIEKNKRKHTKTKKTGLSRTKKVNKIILAEDLLKGDDAIISPHLAYSDLLNKLYLKYTNSQTKEIGFSEKVV